MGDFSLLFPLIAGPTRLSQALLSLVSSTALLVWVGLSIWGERGLEVSCGEKISCVEIVPIWTRASDPFSTQEGQVVRGMS